MRTTQSSFAAGEISPDIYGRIDQSLYQIALRTCSNFIVRQFGGAANRPGTLFVAEGKYPSRTTRKIPFRFNNAQTYILDIGHLYMRIIKDGAEVLEAEKNITAMNVGATITVTSAGHGYSNGHDVYISGVAYPQQVNGRAYRVTNATANTFDLYDYHGVAVDGSAWPAYTSGGTVARIYTVTTPWTESDLAGLNYVQSNNVLTVTHNDYQPRDITRTAHNAWTVAEFANTEGPFQDVNTGATTIIASAASGAGITLTASAALFTADMVGDLIYLEQMPDDTTDRWEVAKAVVANDVRRAGFHYYQAQNNATTGTYRPDHTEGTATDGDGAVTWEYLHSGFGVAEITAFTDTTHVTATVVKRLPDNVVSTATTNWALAAWSATQGYPAAAAYYKGRIWFAGTPEQPSNIWCSGAGLRVFFGSSYPAQDDDSITLKLDTTEANIIQNLVILKKMLALTAANEQVIASADGSVLATAPPGADVDSNIGSSTVRPIVINNVAVFVDNNGNKVYGLGFQFSSDSFAGNDLTLRSPHLFEGKEIVDWCYQSSPFAVIWVCLDDGSLLGLTMLTEQEVLAWHQHDVGGLVESLASIKEGSETSVYMTVKRTINGNVTRYSEKLASRRFTDVRDAHFVDSGLVYDGRNTSAITLTITGGTTWDSPEALTVTASSATFRADDVGNVIVFYEYTAADGSTVTLDEPIRLTIGTYTSPTVAVAVPATVVPVTHRATARSEWELAKDNFFPLYHLEGEEVAVLADGVPITGHTVSGGEITLTSPASIVHIGKAITADIETLDMNVTTQQGNTYTRTGKQSRVFIGVKETSSLKVGIDGTGNLKSMRATLADMTHDAPLPPETNVVEVTLASSWSRKGRVHIQQDQPLPVTVTSITPETTFGNS